MKFQIWTYVNANRKLSFPLFQNPNTLKLKFQIPEIKYSLFNLIKLYVYAYLN